MPLLNQLTIPNWFSVSDILNVEEQPRNNQAYLWDMRDRLFLTLFERLSAAYAYAVPPDKRKTVENVFLACALLPLFVLIYIHVNFIQTPVDCLSPIFKEWPRDGLLRIELDFDGTFARSYGSCQYEGFLVRSLSDARINQVQTSARFEESENQTHFSQKLAFSNIISSISMKEEFNNFRNENLSPEDVDSIFSYLYPFDDAKKPDDNNFYPILWSQKEYIIEYTLEYGFLKLSKDIRQSLKIPTLVVILDPHDEKCFGNPLSQFLLKYIVGFSDVLMSSLKNLVDKDEVKGFVRNVITGDQYRFVSKSLTWTSYGIAAITMIAFTLSISMLLRYSHHQIFMFIVQLLNVLEFNLNVSFPAASLLTVVFALVGMEAIMSEFFNDKTTAFYIILIVWTADQFDNICCHNIITKRHWLRFFFLYHFAFYAYDHRFNGQYSSLALFTSWMFIQHSMVYFYHHFELPSIPIYIYDEDTEPRPFSWNFTFPQPQFRPDEESSNNSDPVHTNLADASQPEDETDTALQPQSPQQSELVPCDSNHN